ncbi:MAG: Lrp/AsnC family transcriptional regulator [Candidatus Nanoarchaeia archaeon]
MDKKEAVLLNYLRVNGRVQLTKLSRKTGVPISTLHDRLKKSPNIRKITALLHFGRLGFSAKAYVLVRANRRYRDDLAVYLKEHFHVNNLYKINNGFDYLLECVFKDMRALEDFIEELDTRFKVRSANVHYIIHDMKREGFLADPDRIRDFTCKPAA